MCLIEYAEIARAAEVDVKRVDTAGVTTPVIRQDVWQLA